MCGRAIARAPHAFEFHVVYLIVVSKAIGNFMRFRGSKLQLERRSRTEAALLLLMRVAHSEEVSLGRTG